MSRRQPVVRRQAQQRNWCFTLNNYTEPECDSIPDSIGRPFGKGSEPNAITYIAFAEETGATGTPHLQGYLQLRKKGTILGIITEGARILRTF